MRNLLFSLLLIAGDPANSQTGPITFQSADKLTSLLELYTSEGCSSCPPAETWLSRLKDAPGLWKDFVPVAFHVDYWDNLGWRDPWAAKQFSERQRAYAQAWRSATIYTPGFVLNGSEWRGWSGRAGSPTVSEVKAGVLKVSSADARRWQVSFVPATPGGSRYDVHTALLSSGLSSEVKAGENRGRRLSHDFVVLTVAKEALRGNAHSFQCEVLLNPEPKGNHGRRAFAVWVTGAGRLEPLQATGGWLP